MTTTPRILITTLVCLVVLALAGISASASTAATAKTPTVTPDIATTSVVASR